MTDTPNLSKLKVNTILAFKKGYSISPCGKLFSPRNKEMKPSWHLKNGNRYARFAFNKTKVYWHHLVAYQKYKEKWIFSDLLVRHLDGDSENNSYLNIKLGTRRDNTMDIPQNKRKRNLKNAHLACRRFTQEEIQKIKNELKTKTAYRIAKEINCNPKTIYDIINGLTYCDWFR